MKEINNNKNENGHYPQSAGDGISVSNAAWTFGGDIPEKFNVHAKKSIPDYEKNHQLIAQISEFFVHKDSHCYDLGTSTGTLIRLLAHHHPQSVRWIGIDCEKNMIEVAQKQWQQEVLAHPTMNLPHIDFIASDINEYRLEKSDFVTAYYTIQFVPPRFRQDLINKIYQTLHWGGAFIMFEKVRGPDARFQDLLTSLYVDFKLQQGLTSEEIIAKSRALKGILEPFSTEGNLGLINRAGFKDVLIIAKNLCFEGYLCIK